MFTPPRAPFTSPGKLSRGQRDSAKRGASAGSTEQMDTSLLDIEDFDENAVDFNLLHELMSESLPLTASEMALLSTLDIPSELRDQSKQAVLHHGSPLRLKHALMQSRINACRTPFAVTQQNVVDASMRMRSNALASDTFDSPRSNFRAQHHSTPTTVCSSMALHSFMHSDDSNSNHSACPANANTSNLANLSGSLNQSLLPQLNLSVSQCQSPSNGPTPTKVRIVFNEKTNQFTIDRRRMLVSSPSVTADSGYLSVSNVTSMSVTSTSTSVFCAPRQVSAALVTQQPASAKAAQLGSTSSTTQRSDCTNETPAGRKRKAEQFTELVNAESVSSAEDVRNPIDAIADSAPIVCARVSGEQNVSFDLASTGTHTQRFSQLTATSSCEDVSDTPGVLQNFVEPSNCLTSTPVSRKSSLSHRMSSFNASHFESVNEVGGSPVPSLIVQYFARCTEVVTPSKTVSNLDELIHGSIVSGFSDAMGSPFYMPATPFKTPRRIPSKVSVVSLGTDTVDGHSGASIDSEANKLESAKPVAAISRARRRLMDDQVFAGVQTGADAMSACSESLALATSFSVKAVQNACQLPHQAGSLQVKRDRCGSIWRRVAGGSSTDQQIMTQLARRFSLARSATNITRNALRRASVSTFPAASHTAVSVAKGRRRSLDIVE